MSEGGFPGPEAAATAYDYLDLNRAVAMYRYFYRSVSGAAIFDGTAAVGVRPNHAFG